MSKYTLPAPSRIPGRVWLTVLAAVTVGRVRSPVQESDRVVKNLVPTPVIQGSEHLPERGPYVIAGNHFDGPGIWVGLAGALIAHSVGKHSPGVRIRGVGVTSYRDFKLGGILPVPDSVTRLAFRRFYRVYSIIPMPRSEEDAFARGAAVRRLLTALKRGEIVILFPEGRNVENFVMRELQPGVGSVFRLCQKVDAPIVPAAVMMEGATYRLCFGPIISIPRRTDPLEYERRIGQAIAAMLPAGLRGPYA